MTFAFVFDAGPFRVRKYESVVIWFDIRVEVVSEEQKANLLDSRLCCWFPRVRSTSLGMGFVLLAQSRNENGVRPASTEQKQEWGSSS